MIHTNFRRVDTSREEEVQDEISILAMSVTLYFLKKNDLDSMLFIKSIPVDVTLKFICSERIILLLLLDDL